MTTAPARSTPPPHAARPPAGGPAPSFTPAIDPVKLLQKYTWLLAVAAVIGGLIGWGGFHVWRILAPEFRSTALFEATPVSVNITEAAAQFDDREMLNFIATRIQDFGGIALLERVVNNPRIGTEAPGWIEGFRSGGGLNTTEAVTDLGERISAGPVPNTNYFTMTVSYRNPNEAAGLARLVTETYIAQTNERARVGRTAQFDNIRKIIDDNEEELDDLQLRRARILRDEGIVSEDAAGDDAQRELNAVIADLSNIRQAVSASRETVSYMEAQLISDAAIPYSDTTRAAVEAGPLVQSLTQQIQALQTERGTMLREGIQPAHRAYRQLEARINAAEAERQQVRERELRRQFETELDAARQNLRALLAQESDTLDRQEALEARLADLTRVFKDLSELDVRIDRITQRRDELREELNELQQLASTTGGRIGVAEAPRVPDRMASPQLFITIALGLFGLTGLTAGLVLLRELLDQRIKGPSDVAMIPRTRVLGVMPLAAEDPANPKHFETIFRDQPEGVLAEHFRQFRTKLLKQLRRGGHRTLLVCSGAPRSGSTGVAANLAYSAVAVDLRVLIIDANYRRPAQHRVFGVDVEPGLAEVLVGHVSLDEAVKSADGGRPHLLTAGSKDLRVFERLGTAPMEALLAEARESYDLIIIDTAPAVVAGDAQALATQCDASLLVVRALSEKRGMVNRIKNELSDSRAEFLGVLVNGVRASAGGYMKRNIRTSHEYQAQGDKAREKADAKARKADAAGTSDE